MKKLFGILVTLISGIFSFLIIKLMQKNINSAGDDPIAKYEAGDFNSLLFFLLLLLFLIGAVSLFQVFAKK